MPEARREALRRLRLLLVRLPVHLHDVSERRLSNIELYLKKSDESRRGDAAGYPYPHGERAASMSDAAARYALGIFLGTLIAHGVLGLDEDPAAGLFSRGS